MKINIIRIGYKLVNLLVSSIFAHSYIIFLVQFGYIVVFLGKVNFIKIRYYLDGCY